MGAIRESEGTMKNYGKKVRDLISAWHLRGAPIQDRV
jgi:hypothetical protein